MNYCFKKIVVIGGLFLCSMSDSFSMDPEPRDETRSSRQIIQSEETASGARFLAHLLTDPMEISRQLIPVKSETWLIFSDLLRFGTIVYNLVHLNERSYRTERIFEFLHYVGDAGERVAVSYDYTGRFRIAMNVLQFGGVAGYILTRLYKHYHHNQSKQD